MHKQRLEQWQEIENISQQMRDMSRLNESLSGIFDDNGYVSQSWQQVSRLDDKRMMLLENFFSIPIGSDEADFLAEKITKMLSLDYEVLAISQTIKNAMTLSFAKMGYQQRAAVAYGSVQTA
ncbi:MAG: hypothetical protein OEY29_13830 [Gammaproteobacteria bacterium]|nr:hypothetical protein [Gammaproteobacteria bacterium]